MTIKTTLFARGADEDLSTGECILIALGCMCAVGFILGFFPALHWMFKAAGCL